MEKVKKEKTTSKTYTLKAIRENSTRLFKLELVEETDYWVLMEICDKALRKYVETEFKN